ncbi:LysR family transcriptional regulator [Azospirillum sp.]|uniref:LysR family transcriptional regulator n=1 Tax=Azospirillum sp. TaxID=34012 RepID=UPI002D5FE58D|nr:LysR family transcriptional regulator [Azospirillum sp.]HYF86442.1 LysR family transcriptional regulator [Azospirillum sp.]
MTELASTPERIANSLRYIRDFLSVAETGSIARSSEVIFKASSAIARAISELEHSLGVGLFERKPRGMLLNAYGEAVRNRARRITDEIAGALEEVARFAKRQQTFERNAVTNLLLNGRGLMLLISVSELRNLSAAAAHVGLSQAGASMALSRMESALGQPLFQRMMQGMVVTDAGALIVSRGKRIVAELRHMQSDVAAIAGTMQGRIAIGALPLGRTHVLPTAIAATLQRHPNIRVTTVESPYEALVAGLRDGDIDFIVGALRVGERNAGLITESLFEDRLGIIARAGHPLAGAPASLKDLLPQRWILPRPGAPGRRLIDQSFRELAIEPPICSVETGDLAVLRGLLKNSDMLTAISPHQLHYEITAGDLIELPVTLGKTVRQIGISLREGAMLSPAALAVLDEIRSASQHLPGEHQT